MSEPRVTHEAPPTLFLYDEEDGIYLSMGPQHPAMHGPWGFRVRLRGEIIVDAEPLTGYIHRGLEKLFEKRNPQQGLILAERVCFMDNVNWQLSYVLALENLLGVRDLVPRRAEWLRAIAAELNRIASHFLFLATYGHDLGLMLAPVLAFRERDLAINLLDKLAGHRITYNYVRVGGVARDAKPSWINEAKRNLRELRKRIKRYYDLYLSSSIFEERTRGNGVLGPEELMKYGITGPVLRASGVPLDLRARDPYLEPYEAVGVDIALGKHGDSYDRVLVRIKEIEESIRIVEDLLDTLPYGRILGIDQPVISLRRGYSYSIVEGSRGWFQFLIVSTGGFSKKGSTPYRVKVNNPCIQMIYLIAEKIKGMTISDAIAFINSMDMCIGGTER
ncbi:NADH-quinone oxidoreductase subunit D [Pyrofollis japonicus]|uniref:NADH-quinone oxidoreductase subunit D n=1 Tax=Pyrofollis japonicus TaxID=3060460 RepID=UPI00295BAA68|nr:hypothetical protein [Pyrofollis japonicus]BEP18381.1 NADH-quinone oxidoreductase subunit D [Pyrofollis japonicus]